MSDFYRSDPNPNEPYGKQPDGGENGWGGQPYTPYAAPAQPIAGGDAPLPQDGFMSPTSFGAEMQRGGVPLYGGTESVANSFRLQGDDAPTRIGKPIQPQQQVSKRTTVERPSFAPPAEPAKPGASRAAMPPQAPAFRAPVVPQSADAQFARPVQRRTPTEADITAAGEATQVPAYRAPSQSADTQFARPVQRRTPTEADITAAGEATQAPAYRAPMQSADAQFARPIQRRTPAETDSAAAGEATQAPAYRAPMQSADTQFARPIQRRTPTETDSAAAPQGSPFERPVVRTAVDNAESAAPTTGEQGGIRVRRRRMERHDDEQAQPVQAPVSQPAQAAAGMDAPAQFARPAEAPAPDYDPFSAGDSEIDETESAMARRAAVPGGRYTGARTAMPSAGREDGGVAAHAREARERVMNQREPGAAAETGEPSDLSAFARRPAPSREQLAAQRPAQPAQRPAQPGQRPPQRPQQPGQRPPQQPAQRPQQQQQGGTMPVRRSIAALSPEAMSDTGAQRPARKQMLDYGTQRQHVYRGTPAQREGYPAKPPQSTVPRPPYDFEETPDAEPETRRMSPLVVVVVILLVIGGLLAAICLPNWETMGGVGGFVAPVKEKVVGLFTTVKNMISPEAAEVKSFSVAASDTAAPAQLMFTVQTTRSTSGIRIVDDLGNTLYQRFYSSDPGAGGDLTVNSNALIWNPAYELTSAYSGGFTVYAQRNDGTEAEGFRCENLVTVESPKPSVPPMQSFTCDTQTAAAPARVAFTFVTSKEVSAVRVTDQYAIPLVTMYATDTPTDDASMTENTDARVWTLYCEIGDAYSGSCYALYQTESGDLGFTLSDLAVKLEISEGGEATPQPLAQPDGDTGDVPAEALETVQPQAALLDGTAEPIATPEPTAEPTPEPTAEPAPTTTPLAVLPAAADASADPSALSLDATIYQDYATANSFSRTKLVSVLNPFTTYVDGSNYAAWRQAGVLTFRSGPFRQNASYGTVEVQKNSLTQQWTSPVGQMKVNKATLYGVTAPGQPVIVKWPQEVRPKIGLHAEAKDVTALKEVMIAGADGKIYFFNLLTGEASRDPIELGAPSAGGLSLATNGMPVLGVGQSHSRLASKTVKNGYHLINLITNKELELYLCDGKDKNSNYTGVTGAALFDAASGLMVFGSQNGVLYTAELGKQEEAYNNETGRITLGTSVQGYKSVIKGQKKTDTNIDGSVAMYDRYVYYGDQEGVVQCVDINTMTPVWAVNTGDNVDSTPALDMEDGVTVALYTGNTILNQGKKGVCTIRRLDALTGKQAWAYEVPAFTYNTKFDMGVYASPVVGQNSISELVIYTVSKGKDGSAVIALNKKTGALVWETALPANTISSPVAVYNEAGDAWIIQAESNGNINMLNGKTGAILSTTAVTTAEGDAVEIEASPAVYGNMLVIGTTGKGLGGVYCLKIE